MYAVDQSYAGYERRLLELMRRDALGASTLSLMLSTLASSIEGHAELVRSLSAANTVVTGTNAAIGRDYLMNQTMNTMLTQMRANRSRQRALILGRLGNTIANYPICIALSDALAFEQAGTLTEAIVRTSEAAALENRRNEEDVRNAIQTVQFTNGPLLDALRSYLDIDDTQILAERRQRIITAVNELGIGPQGSQSIGQRLSRSTGSLVDEHYRLSKCAE
jgi:hypothetical protein